MVGRDVMKIHPCRVSAHFVAVQMVETSSRLGNKRKLSALMFKEPRTPARWCGAFGSINIQYSVPLIRRSISAGLDIHETSCAGVGDMSSGGRRPSAVFYKEPVCHTFRLVEGDSQGFGFGFTAKFVRWIPIWHPRVEGLSTISPLRSS